jgi:hypothetical protein
MVVSPILRGLFGLQTDAQNHQITLAPHLPADWTSFALRNVHLGQVNLGQINLDQVNLDQVNLDFRYHKTLDSITLETTRTGTGDCWVEFSPAFSLRSEVVSVEMNGRPLPFKIQPNSEDQHVSVRFPVYGGPNSVVIRVKNDFGLALANQLPALGSTSRALRVLSNSWNSERNQLTVEVSGAPGAHYDLGVWNPEQISSVEGAILTKAGSLRIEMEVSNVGDYLHHKIVIHFGKS